MDLSFRPDLSDFRDEIRQFLVDNLPPDVRLMVQRSQPIDRTTHTAWHKLLLARGWAAPSWPQEHGGPGWTLSQQYIFEQELAGACAPRPIFFGLDMLAPTLMDYGSAEQRAYFLPRILSGEQWWCQGFSEPNAGSDLAALKCRAELVDDHYVINGSKIWTSDAQDADWMGGLFRTDSTGKKQHGITVLLLKMDSVGLTIEPTKTFEGGVEVNQTFFDDVRVPVTQRLGDEHQGWGIAKFMLAQERLGIPEVARTKAMLSRLKTLTNTTHVDNSTLSRDENFAQQVYQLEIDLLSLEATEQRYLFSSDDPNALGAEISILKVRGSELQQRATELYVDALGYFALGDIVPPADGSNTGVIGPEAALFAARAYFNQRKTSIYGGSNEIMKNIVSKVVLGL